MFAKLDPSLEATRNAKVRSVVAIFEIVDVEMVEGGVLHVTDSTFATPLSLSNKSARQAGIFAFVFVNLVGVST